ncbi:hypothetical protein [uncultured Roseovarius sp.]|uniref:hypothetical protein n=1 Tax=uncultured Roseovarius sp. TaxID=293344 RepID=UPI000C5A5EFB|nr:hypothetical protein [Roseovarius sp.]MBD12816.1 hypothetical protein [Roseovarius sp.]|tara:strand:+ start:1094 stop:1306 length:213 start_codon:yes stop_codon:yes gene_type:complete
MRLSDLIPNAGRLQAEIAAIPQAQRVALALQLVRDIDEPCCALPLMRLSRLAEDHHLSIRKEAFVRERAR